MHIPSGNSIVILVFCFVFLTTPVAADPLEPTYTRFFFKDAQTDLSESVNFSLTCSGVGTDQPYSRTWTCEPDDCAYTDSYVTWIQHYASNCSLEGTYRGKTIRLANMPLNSVAQCYPTTYWFFGKFRKVYAMNRTESAVCKNDTEIKLRTECEPLLIPFRNVSNQSEIVYLSNKTRWEKTGSFIACTRQVYAEEPLCYDTYDRIKNDSRIIRENPSMYCEIQLNLAYGNGTDYIPQPVSTPAVTRSPVESLYCGILNFFGRTCT